MRRTWPYATTALLWLPLIEGTEQISDLDHGELAPGVRESVGLGWTGAEVRNRATRDRMCVCVLSPRLFECTLDYEEPIRDSEMGVLLEAHITIASHSTPPQKSKRAQTNPAQ
jgi:hypothetical protein